MSDLREMSSPQQYATARKCLVLLLKTYDDEVEEILRGYFALLVKQGDDERAKIVEAVISMLGIRGVEGTEDLLHEGIAKFEVVFLAGGIPSHPQILDLANANVDGFEDELKDLLGPEL